MIPLLESETETCNTLFPHLNVIWLKSNQTLVILQLVITLVNQWMLISVFRDKLTEDTTQCWNYNLKFLRCVLKKKNYRKQWYCVWKKQVLKVLKEQEYVHLTSEELKPCLASLKLYLGHIEDQCLCISGSCSMNNLTLSSISCPQDSRQHLPSNFSMPLKNQNY